MERPPSPPFGTLIESIRGSDLNALNQTQSGRLEPKAEITDCSCVASYNWVDQHESLILVPGMPAAWTPPREPSQLEKDSGNYYRDQNAARSPKHPMEPAVRALLAENEEFDTQSIDLFACSSTLGSLLRFARRIDDRPFRFFVEAVENTVFFVRRENSPTQFIERIRGYGHAFPEAYTTWPAAVKGSASHQRLLNYTFSELRCVVRFEADGYLPSEASYEDVLSETRALDYGSDDLDSITDPKEDASGTAKWTNNKQIKIQKAGQEVPRGAIFELKTRSVRSIQDPLPDALPRCWLARIQHFILARHDHGWFETPEVHSMRDKVDSWEDGNQQALRRLGWMLRKIVDLARARPDGKLEVLCEHLYCLELREQDTDEHAVLPLDLKKRWLGGSGNGDHLAA